MSSSASFHSQPLSRPEIVCSGGGGRPLALPAPPPPAGILARRRRGRGEGGGPPRACPLVAAPRAGRRHGPPDPRPPAAQNAPPAAHVARQLPLQHVARRCARCRRPRAPPGPPPPVGCRHPGGAGPQPAAPGHLQSGEAAGLARFRRRFVVSRGRSPLGAKALRLFVPQFTQSGLEGFAAVYLHTPSLPPLRAFWPLRRL